jgi:hypothetical protein
MWKFFLLQSAFLGAYAGLPYNPTSAFSSNSSLYVLRPSPDESTFQLDLINATTPLSSSNLTTTTLSRSLPFEINDKTALLSAIDPQDNVYVVAGDCGDGASNTQLWTFTQSTSEWSQRTLSIDKVNNPASNAGINFLSSAVAFSHTIDGPDLYVFGGMCPNQSSLTIDNWQASASYSNTMLLFEASDNSQYAVTELVNRGPPISEAGFSWTPLAPAYLNSTGRSGIGQQNFVLVGGQTSTAFVNMSQIALFSLPEETWSFISVNNPAGSSSIDPRSGHAATISNDGKKIFIYGGWVGDLSGAADPPFLVLELGSEYGGTGDWQWNVPEQQGTIPTESLYGHAMVMLPGDVLMITGGYTIPSTSSKVRRQNGPALSTATYFYNTSSNAWSNDYLHPNTVLPSITPAPSNSSNSTKIGLGVGLGVGLVILMAVAICIWFFRRAIRQQRRERDRRLLQQSMNAANGPQPFADTAGQFMQERTNASRNAYPWAPIANNQNNLSHPSEAERTGLLLDIPSPTRGLRRSLHARPNNYWYEEGRRSRGSGHIHPIDEREEYEDIQNVQVPETDPFQDPQHLLDRRSPSPQTPAQEREMELQGWMSDWAAAEMRQNGRVSPNKSDRTSSTLSDSSHSLVSALSYQPSIHRSGSERSNGVPSSVSQVSPPESPTRRASPSRYRRPRSFTLGERNSDSSRPTSFPRLQAEGQALLGGPPSTNGQNPAAEVLARPPSRARNILGNVKRALIGGERNSAGTPGRSASSAGMSERLREDTSIPQRSASAGAMLWRRRQGARDWDYDTPPGAVSLGESRALEDEDWDVESAVERRVVQVMFTVPKEKLRVVNAGPDGDGASIVSNELSGPLIDTSDRKNKGKENEEME